MSHDEHKDKIVAGCEQCEDIIVEASTRAAANFGKPENMWNDEGIRILENGIPTEAGIEWFKRMIEENT